MSTEFKFINSQKVPSNTTELLNINSIYVPDKFTNPRQFKMEKITKQYYDRIKKRNSFFKCFINTITKCNQYFELRKVKAHKNNYYNNIVDKILRLKWKNKDDSLENIISLCC